MTVPESYSLATYNPGHDGHLDLFESAIKADVDLLAKYAYAESGAGSVVAVFTSALSGAEKTDLDAIVTTWGLDDTKRRLFGLIDAKANSNIMDGSGFEYPAASGNYLSLSANAQLKWSALCEGRSSLTYPLKVRTKDDTTQVSLADAAAVGTAQNAALAEIRTLLDPAEDAKDNVQAAATIAAAQAAADVYLG